MDAGGAWARWRNLSPWLRWGVAYAAALLLCLGAGALTPLGVGNALFLGGALLVVASALFIRTGGTRKRVVHRDLQGRPIGRVNVSSEERTGEIRLGMGLFLMGLGLWAPLLALTWRA